MPITTYTTYGDVRAALGVSEMELTDTELELAMYENALELAMDEVTLDSGLTLQAAFAAATPTSRIKRLTQLYATYAVAEVAANALSMLAPKTISDSKTSLSRFSSEATFKSVITSISRLKASYKQMLEETTVASQTLLTVVKPAIDKVTGV
jgi:hypothetical protein